LTLIKIIECMNTHYNIMLTECQESLEI
jgi:hypothetical protein